MMTTEGLRPCLVAASADSTLKRLCVRRFSISFVLSLILIILDNTSLCSTMLFAALKAIDAWFLSAAPQYISPPGASMTK